MIPDEPPGPENLKIRKHDKAKLRSRKVILLKPHESQDTANAKPSKKQPRKEGPRNPGSWVAAKSGVSKADAGTDSGACYETFSRAQFRAWGIRVSVRVLTLVCSARDEGCRLDLGFRHALGLPGPPKPYPQTLKPEPRSFPSWRCDYQALAGRGFLAGP